jgi:dTDP-glucose pyrophosphorylase
MVSSFRYDTKSLQGVILAAGQGKRLHPITASRTKAMAPVVGKPIIERVMDTMLINGIKSFVLVVSPDDADITEHFNKVSGISAEINIIPQQQPLGMGHALMTAGPFIHGDFVLSSCDNLVDPHEIKQMLSYWFQNESDAILTTLQVSPEEIIRMGIVELEGNKVTKIIEKPSLDESPTNIGSIPLYVFSHEFLKYLSSIKPSPRGEYELQDAVQMLIDDAGEVCQFRLSGRRDLTTPQDLLAINLHFLSHNQIQSGIDLSNTSENTIFNPPLYIGEEVKIGSNCVIGPNVYLERGCVILDKVELQSTVVLRRRIVQNGSIIRDKVIW